MASRNFLIGIIKGTPNPVNIYLFKVNNKNTRKT